MCYLWKSEIILARSSFGHDFAENRGLVITKNKQNSS